MIAPEQVRASSRNESAFVLLLMQAMLWMVAGLSAIPFALAGEVVMLALGIVTLLLALATGMAGIGVVWRWRWARRYAIVLEILCVTGSALLLILPVGANHGPVALMTNVALPIAVIALLRKA